MQSVTSTIFTISRPLDFADQNRQRHLTLTKHTVSIHQKITCLSASVAVLTGNSIANLHRSLIDDELIRNLWRNKTLSRCSFGFFLDHRREINVAGSQIQPSP